MGWINRLTRVWQSMTGTPYGWPALDITLPGKRTLHLVGSIHMGIRDMSPLPARLLKKVCQADALVVEADISHYDALFDNLATYPPLAERLTREQYARLTERTAKMGISLAALDKQPLWQVAMSLQATQAQTLGLRPDYGIDYQLLIAAYQHNIPVIELEGAQQQLALLEALPDNGLGLLQDTLIHWHTNAHLLQMMISGWLAEQPTRKPITLPSTFSPALYDTLMCQRNLAWCEKLQTLPAGHYVVAVGALHLYGEGNLPEMLR